MGLDLIPLKFPLGVGLEGGSPWQGGLLGGGSPWQGVSLAWGSPWQGGLLGGVSLAGGLLGMGVSLAGGSPWQGGLPGRGVSLAGGVSQHALRQIPPLNRMTDACENITLPQTSFAGGKNAFKPAYKEKTYTHTHYHNHLKSEH